jgi:hypothetical protein
MKAIGTVAAIAASVIAVQLTTASQASAQPACPSNRFCGWDYGDSPWAYFSSGSADFRQPIGGVVFDNRFWNGLNRTQVNWCLFDGYYYTGTRYVVGPGRYIGIAFQDKTSSLKPC